MKETMRKEGDIVVVEDAGGDSGNDGVLKGKERRVRWRY